MEKAQFAILRFAKYKGPEIGQIEAHNERTKETYASNPDIDPARKHLNYNLLTPPPKYRAEVERQIKKTHLAFRGRNFPESFGMRHFYNWSFKGTLLTYGAGFFFQLMLFALSFR